MTAELGECNGVVEGCRTETEEVEVHAIPKPLHEENLKLNEDKVGVSGGGSESSVDDDEVFLGGAQCEAELSNATVDVGDHAPQLPVEDHELEIRDEGHSPECLLSHNKAVDDELVENGETDWQLRVSVDGHPGIELHDSANKPTKKVEVPCLVDRDDGVENYFVGNKVELPCLVNGDDKVEGDLVENKPELPCFLNGEERAERDIVGNNLESPRLGKGEETVERDLVGDKFESLCFINGEDGAERNYMGNNELEQRSHLVAEVQEIDSPELVIGNDEKSEQCFSNEQNQANDELEETNSMVSQENCECQSQNLENGDDACGHAIDEGKQHEPLFVLNADKGPELECVVDKSTDFESHIVVTDNDEIERECLPDGNNEMEAQFDVIVHKELESGCFVDENNGILTEDLDEQQVEEVHHGKNEISDLESSDCNGTNTGGLSDVLDKNSGGYNVTVIADMQEDTAVSAADCVSVGVPDSSNGLFTPVSGNEQKPEAEVPKKLFYCLVRIPRHVDNKIRAQIRLAQLQLDDKTQSRDFIRAAIQMKRVSREQIIERLKAARQEEKAFRDAIKSKRQEMEPVQSTLNRMKNATSVEEYDEKIYQMQYRIEHESMPLREEKQMLRDMKQLKVSRDQLCAIAGPHSELQEAFIHIDKIQERSKLLGQELDSLRKQAFQAEKNLQAIEKELDALNIDSRQLQEQWEAADIVRQEAYEALKSLKKQEYDRNYEFYRCKDDNKAARQYANRHNREALDKLCSNQVERIMEIWNKNVEFRKEYVKDNERSILKRLETLDGRSLGPDEEPPLPTNYSDDLYPSLQPQGKPSASGIRSTTEAQPMTIAQQSNQMESKANRQQNSSNEVAVPQKKAVGRSKKSQPESSPLIPEIESYEVSPVPLKVKEEDLAKKEEEAAKVKERIRQEEMRKAKEAEERKRRQTEKAHAKALARAQKETERKEKEKQKKANKKAAAAAAAATNTAGNDTAFSLDKVESGASSHDFKSSPVELKEVTPETQKLAVSQRKKSVSQKVKPKSVFPAAKKGRKGLQTWMWVLLAVCFCLAALLLFFYF